MIELVCNLHSHTRFSDGAGFHRDVVAAAARAGLDVVGVTDHNVWVGGLQGYHNRVLLLVGEEVHDPCRQPQANHALILGAGQELAPLASSPQALIRAARELGALVFLAHPVEYAPRWLQSRLGEPALPWVDREVVGFTGLELWNTMSEFKARLRTPLHALYYAFFPHRFLFGPFPEAVRWWEQLWLSEIPAVAIGGADAHAHLYALGPLRRVLFPYEWLFRAVNTHILVDHPLQRRVEEDWPLIRDALQAGRAWVANDLLGSSRGFRFEAYSGHRRATMGETLRRAGAVQMEAVAPLPGEFRLIRFGDGVVARARGRMLRHLTAEPGIYRIQVYRGGRLWILTNPIRVI
ncbi:PHP domain-containing protein [Thermoflexus sp.]|uniref:PHP domain-containing protein n=1 Tax=Thermoflexus sp. TaxID=1969742 RepID=UPI002ADE148E|nr:PHP domain-containing protein [Thermoflexus sp.]